MLKKQANQSKCPKLKEMKPMVKTLKNHQHLSEHQKKFALENIKRALCGDSCFILCELWINDLSDGKPLDLNQTEKKKKFFLINDFLETSIL